MSNHTKGAIRKTVHRSTSEVPLKSSECRINVLRHSLPTTANTDMLDTNYKSKHKYHEPKLNTSIALNTNMEKNYIPMKSQTLKQKSVSELTPPTKASLYLEKTKLLNFPPDKSVYKNLIPININDSILNISNNGDADDNKSCKFLRKKYVRKSNKDPIPELADFLEPIKPLQLKLPQYDKQDILRKPKNDLYPLVYKICTEYHPGY